MIFNEFLIFVFFMFLPVPQVPEPVRKLRETHRKNSHQFRSKSEGFCRSYDQKRTLRRLIIVQGGLIRSTGVVLVVLVLVFLVPGVVSLVLVDVVACHYVYYH